MGSAAGLYACNSLTATAQESSRLTIVPLLPKRDFLFFHVNIINEQGGENRTIRMKGTEQETISVNSKSVRVEMLNENKTSIASGEFSLSESEWRIVTLSKTSNGRATLNNFKNDRESKITIINLLESKSNAKVALAGASIEETDTIPYTETSSAFEAEESNIDFNVSTEASSGEWVIQPDVSRERCIVAVLTGNEQDGAIPFGITIIRP